VNYIKRLEKLMTRLRSKNGCPWDKKQNHKSLKPYLLEETHEVLEAIESGDPGHLREELGDLLLQVVFHAQLAKEKGLFDLQAVARTIGDKLVRRHPHVFGNSSRKMQHIFKRWEEIKRQEKPQRKSAFEGLPKSLPALLRAQRMHEKIAQHDDPKAGSKAKKGLDKAWKDFQRSLKTGKRSSQEKAAGEFLFQFTRLARTQGLHAEMALREASARFENSLPKPKNR
jgi:MazG family protein